MKAVVLSYGKDVDVTISHETIPVPPLRPDALRIKVAYASANPVDSKYDWWSAMIPSDAPKPFVVGVDGAGVVEAIGDAVPDGQFSVGDRIVSHNFVFNGTGTFAEYAVVPAASAVKLPASIPFDVAAAVPCAGWTAYKAVVTKLKASAGQSIFITAGNGGVGGFALQIAKHLGCNPIITTCSPTNNDRVRSLGATHTIDYHGGLEAVVEAILKICPEGVELAVDVVSAESATSLLPALAYDGELACVAGVVTRGGPGDGYLKGWSVHDIALGPAAYFPGHPERLRAIGEAFMALVEAGSIDAMITNSVPLADTVTLLHDVVKKGRAKGKVVIKVQDV